jgi:putative two-component system response regulator
MVRQKTAQIFNLQNAVLSTVTDLVEFRDDVTGGHIARTQKYLTILLDKLIKDKIYTNEISGWDMDYLLPSAQLHDVGKIAISDLILNKPGKLTQEEFEIMKTHAAIGVDAIKKIEKNTEEHAFLRHAKRIAGTHHEKWDGTGYPAGLKGEDIPLEGRLMAIADVYDALISTRPYKKAFSTDEARQIIESGKGTHFDPVLVEVFSEVVDQFAAAARDL